MRVFKGIISNLGAVAFLIGLGGLGGACETGNGFLLSAIVFSIGIGLCYAGLNGKEGTWTR